MQLGAPAESPCILATSICRSFLMDSMCSFSCKSQHGMICPQEQVARGARREAELQRRVLNLTQDAQAAAESQSMLQGLNDHQEATSAALAVSLEHPQI